MVNFTQMRVQLNGQEQILIQAAFVLTKIAPMALTVDADWFQLRFFITGNQIIISDQFVSPVCSSVMNFPIVTTSALFCDSMIAEIAQIGDVRKYPAEKYSQQGIFVSLRPLCANFELLRYQRCSLDTFFFFGLAECDIAGRDEVTSPYTLRWCISDHVKISTQRSL